MHRLSSLLLGALFAGAFANAAAEEIAVGNYGVSANGMPFGVALAKGYFKEEGLNITGLISSAGGGRRCATCWRAAASRTAR
jgi:NitT/TauT family transport system substrate-binding protein